IGCVRATAYEVAAKKVIPLRIVRQIVRSCLNTFIAGSIGALNQLYIQIVITRKLGIITQDIVPGEFKIFGIRLKCLILISVSWYDAIITSCTGTVKTG